MVECELEEEDDWVVVKKQKITVLVSPPSPSHPQITSSDKNETQPIIAKRSSGVQKRRKHELTDDKHEDPSARPAPAIDPSAVETGLSSDDQQPILIKDSGNGKGIMVQRRSVNVPRAAPIGALNVGNLRVRAHNLERKLQGTGGLRRWLVSQGLERFVEVFERERVGKYELVNLTMSMLKDMGMDAVGPRRKLLHAIECLSRPYYFNFKVAR